MKTWRIGLRLLRRDWRSGELHLMAAALVLTVGAVTAVAFFTDRIERAMQGQGSQLLAADLVVESSTSIPQSPYQFAELFGLETAETLAFRSVVIGEKGPQLVQVKAVDRAYPLRGSLTLRRGIAADETEMTTGPAAGEVWIEPRLLYLLDSSVGGRIKLGAAEFRIGALITYEPDRGAGLFQLAPRVMLNLADIPATGLVTPASRVRHRLLLAGDAAAVAGFKRAITNELPPNTRLTDARDARPEFASAVERASRFLHLATLVTVLVAGAAVALAGRRLVERQTDAVAVMRCLGAQRHLLTRVILLRLSVFGLLASLAGIIVGLVAQTLLAGLLGSWLAPSLPAPGPEPILVGLATGMVTLVGFAVPPLVQLAKVTPLRALRRDLGTPRVSAAASLVLAACALALLIYWQAADPELAGYLLVGTAAALICLGLCVFLLVRLGRSLSHRVRGVWRLGLSFLTRRPAGALLQIGGFGLGVLALLLLAVVRVDLMRTWHDSLPLDAPNRFVLNIQPHEVDSVRDYLSDHGMQSSGLFPMIRGRLLRIGDTQVDPDSYEDPRAQRLAAREFNLSIADRPQRDNRITAGAWWSDPHASGQFSVEEGLAESLGIRLGDTLTFWVSGREIRAPVTSLRRVQWDSFNVNFFVLAPRSLLGQEAATHITSFHAGDQQEARLAELLRRFPGLTLVDIDALMGQIRRIMDQGAAAIELVFGFTLVAGIVVIIAGIQASLDERRAAYALLRTLGAGRRRLLAALVVEFAAMGLLAGLLASLFAELIGLVLARELFGLEYGFNPALWSVGVIASTVGIGLAGTLATYPLLVRPPLRSLR